MLIRLEFNGRIIHEISSGAISGEILIGRSHSCTWPVPKEDTVSSSRHAALFVKGGAVWLKDLGSTNGTFHNGKKIEKKKLAVNDKIGLGNCVLCVEPERGREGKAFSELSVRSGKARGQKKQLKPPAFVIGSDPSADLVFLDTLVSRRHAEILVKEDGSCWVRDLGSKNGTAVNGMPLRDDKERLLKDGDRISFSHMEVDFLDGAVKRSNKQTWLRVGILVATLLAGTGMYRVYQGIRPSAESYIRSARKLAAQEKFTAAAETVDKAANARRASHNQVTIEELRRLLGIWESTLALWRRAKESLEQGRWTQVSRDLGMLQATKKDAWEWNEEAADENANALRAKAMLDALLRAEASIGREDIRFDMLAEDHDAVAKALAGLGAETPAYLTPLKAELEKIRERQSVLLAESHKMEEALNMLSQEMPPYREIVKVVEEACDSKEEALRRRARVVRAPLQALAQSFGLLAAAAQNVRELEMQKAMAEDISLPSVDACTIDPRLSQARKTLEKADKNLKVKAGQLNMLLGEVVKRIGLEGDSPEMLAVFQDQTVMDKVLACDTLDSPMPRRSRQEPSGAYDRVLGVEEFYEYLSALPEPVNPALVSDLPFVSMLTQARDLLQKIEALETFVSQPENRWMNAGKLARQMTRMATILASREALMKEYATRAETASGRAALIAGGIAMRLSPKAGAVKVKGQPLETWLEGELKGQRASLQQLNGEYSLAPAVRQIEIRNEVMSKGLPGDPLVRAMWARRDAAVSATGSAQ
ncbi:MAG: FHA domain-containing protein [Kiritimatiellae bacterium]|nr:FHA domain-containing protein [Kiritimatiellia bacterium]